MKGKSESEVVQSCPTLSNPMDSSLPGSSVHGIFQARVLEWGAIASLMVFMRNKQTKIPVQVASFQCEVPSSLGSLQLSLDVQVLQSIFIKAGGYKLFISQVLA